MNIRAVVGGGSQYKCLPFGPDMPRKRQRKWYSSYLISTVDLPPQSWVCFSQRIEAGLIVPYEVRDERNFVVCAFGLEILQDKIGTYVGICYLEGIDFREYAGEVIHAIWRAARAFSIDDPRCHIPGRRGWRRFLRRFGIRMEVNGFVNGRQEAFYNGRF